jgi:hypothetical protein
MRFFHAIIFSNCSCFHFLLPNKRINHVIDAEQDPKNNKQNLQKSTDERAR